MLEEPEARSTRKIEKKYPYILEGVWNLQILLIISIDDPAKKSKKIGENEQIEAKDAIPRVATYEKCCDKMAVIVCVHHLDFNRLKNFLTYAGGSGIVVGDLYGMLRANPVIAAVKEDNYFDIAVASPCKVIFLLTGNVCTVEDIVCRAKAVGKGVYIHIDLIDGFGKDKYALRYIKERVAPEGIITTKAPLIKIAKDLGMTVIQRVFLIDNLSFKTGIQTIKQVRPDAVEVMPGIMPLITEKMCQAISIPVITGGLVNDVQDIKDSLKAGAVGVSTSTSTLWKFRREMTK